jgi:serine/threonine protein kinase
VHHPNLVQLIGYYTSSEKKNPVQMLVYEYMSGGTLMDHLYGRMTGEGILEWRDRLSLTVGAATGIIKPLLICGIFHWCLMSYTQWK